MSDARLAQKRRLDEAEQDTEITLAFDDNRHASLVFGHFDQNLVKLERRLRIVCVASGNHVTLRGPSEACEHAQRALEILYGRVQLGQEVGLGDVDGAVEESARQRSLFPEADAGRAVFDQILNKEGIIGARLVKVVAQRRREVENKIEQLIFKDVNSKLAELLLRLGEEYGIEDSRGTLVSLKITHQEMANLIGSTRETVSLTLSQFKRRGFIHTDGRKVILADRDGLKALA